MNKSEMEKVAEIARSEGWFIPKQALQFEEIPYEGGSPYRRSFWMSDVAVTCVRLDWYYSSYHSSYPLDFLQIARIWNKARHPNIVTMFGANPQDRLFVCEYARKGELSLYLRNQPDMGRSVVWAKLYEVAIGLRYLHSLDIIHGDLRCINIVVTKDGTAKLTGFELSFEVKEYPPDVSKLGAVRWRAPECYIEDGAGWSFAADVYSLGMCIFEAVTGEPPWGTNDDEEILEHLYNGDFLEKPSQMTDEQWDLVERMCKSNPNDRIPLAEVVERLKQFAVDEENQKWRVVVERSLALCSEMLEAESLCRHAAYRLLTLVNRSLAALPGVETDVDFLANRLESLMNKRVDQATAFRLVSARAFAEAVESIHIELDRFESKNDGSPSWREQWVQDVNHMKQTLFASVDGNSGMTRFVHDLSDEDKQTEAMALFIHEIKHNAEHYAPHELEMLRKLLNQVVSFSNLRVPELEEWFIPRHEVEIGEFLARGGFGEVWHGRWWKTDVVIKTIKIEKKDAFLQEVKVWRQARHQNVIPFLGAYHLDSPFFIVCEYAPGGTLTNYLYKHRGRVTSCVWRKLVEVARGLCFLHGRGIVHGDLKCDNILIGSDERAMLTDFGMSFFEGSETRADAKNLGALRWRAPEVVERGIAGATFASDVFSLGMCVVEAVTGVVPWGLTIPDAAVKHRLHNKQMLNRPSGMEDSEWEVVEHMCRYEPVDRMSLENVIKKFEDFAYAEEDREIEMKMVEKEESQRQDI